MGKQSVKGKVSTRVRVISIQSSDSYLELFVLVVAERKNPRGVPVAAPPIKAVWGGQGGARGSSPAPWSCCVGESGGVGPGGKFARTTKLKQTPTGALPGPAAAQIHSPRARRTKRE